MSFLLNNNIIFIITLPMLVVVGLAHQHKLPAHEIEIHRIARALHGFIGKVYVLYGLRHRAPVLKRICYRHSLFFSQIKDGSTAFGLASGLGSSNKVVPSGFSSVTPINREAPAIHTSGLPVLFTISNVPR